MLTLILRRLMAGVVMILFVLSFNFFLFRVVESDPVGSLYRGRNISAEQRERIQERYGLNGSKPEQFVKYVREMARGNFGYSYANNRPVSTLIREKLWPTLWLVGISTLLSTLLGTIIGIWSAWHRGSWRDYLGTGTTMLLYAMPDFWLAMIVLVWFGREMGWFPLGGLEDPSSDAVGLTKLLENIHHLVLPGLVLTLSYLGEYALVMRSSLIEVMGEDYLTVARAKGLRDKFVRSRHAVRNAMLPVITLITLNFGFVLGGAIAVESIFSIPGLGNATLAASKGPDLPMLQALFLLFSVSVIVMNIVAEILYMYFDPRVRTR